MSETVNGLTVFIKPGGNTQRIGKLQAEPLDLAEIIFISWQRCDELCQAASHGFDAHFVSPLGVEAKQHGANHFFPNETHCLSILM